MGLTGPAMEPVRENNGLMYGYEGKLDFVQGEHELHT